MAKRVYISADYSPNNGDREVVDILNRWGSDSLHKINFVDTAKVVSGSVANDFDCRFCDLKKEFNEQIKASSVVIFIVGDKTANRSAGSNCSRINQVYGYCTPYKQNTNGKKRCKVILDFTFEGDVSIVNTYSFLRHEFEQAKKRGKTIIVLYNSLCRESTWLPEYMKSYESIARPFWIKNSFGEKVGNYAYIKKVLENE